LDLTCVGFVVGNLKFQVDHTCPFVMSVGLLSQGQWSWRQGG
jgi:hypothetical protein